MRSRKPGDNKAGKIKKLFRAAGFADILSEGGLSAVKLHFGERANMWKSAQGTVPGRAALFRKK